MNERKRYTVRRPRVMRVVDPLRDQRIEPGTVPLPPDEQPAPHEEDAERGGDAFAPMRILFAIVIAILVGIIIGFPLGAIFAASMLRGAP